MTLPEFHLRHELRLTHCEHLTAAGHRPIRLVLLS